MAYYSRPEEILKRFRSIFEANKSRLEIKYVALQNENLIPEYPALELVQGPMRREIHGTQKFLLTFEVSFWIYHANFESGHAYRSIEDMELTTNVVRFLHEPDMRKLLDETEPGPNQSKIIFAHVAQEISGVIARPQRSGIITTRLVWIGQSEVNFNDS